MPYEWLRIKGVDADLPEGNAPLAVLDLATREIEFIESLGFKASPGRILQFAQADAIDGLGRLMVARATFDPSGIAAQRETGAHTVGVTLPIGAVVCGGFFNVVTAFTTSASGTLALSIQSANDIQTATVVSSAPFSTTGLKAITPKANTPESTGIKLTAARAVTFTVATGALTAGKLVLFLYYVQSE
jgi:hypothetical protein